MRNEPTKTRGSIPELADAVAEVDLTVVVPFYNPGRRLLDTVMRAMDTLRSTGVSFELVAVSDGSTDGSEESLDVLPTGMVCRLVLPHQGGKGLALRAGLSQGRGRYLGFIDGDGDVPPELLADFVAIAQEREPDIILGSKRHPESQVVYPVARRMYSWGYQQLVRLLFRMDVRDTQAGIKLVRREVLSSVLPHMMERGYAFDLELLVVARHLGFRRFVEAPVRIGQRFSSTISIRAVAAIFRDTVRIFWRLRVSHAYRAA